MKAEDQRNAPAGSTGTVLDAQSVTLTIDELALACRVERTWIIERIEAGLIEIEPGDDPHRWRFVDVHLSRVRCMRSMERQMGANPELAALVADLVEEVRTLRARLASRDSA